MPNRDRFREEITGPLTPEMLERKAVEGWRPVAIEWERETADGVPGRVMEAVPFGLRVAADHVHLEENAAEVEAMLAILEGIVADWPMSRIAADLNRRGYQMRNGFSWTQTAVFELLPRLIEFGPRLFNRTEWVERRRLVREKMAAH